MPTSRTAMVVSEFLLVILGIGYAAPFDANVAGSWRNVSSTAIGHESAGLTLLADGRVLVAGGHALTRGRRWELIDGCELYDPKTTTWQSTGPLVEKRQAIGSLVALKNGKILLAGEHDPLTSAELYDPRTGKWSATGNLRTGRGGHSSTLLADGKVLIAGGINYTADGTPIFASAELYDPETGNWTETGSMAVPRFKHAAVRLTSGEVLVVGGTSVEPSDRQPLASAEIYNPTTGIWRGVGRLTTAREQVRAVLLADDRVLVTGGAFGPFGKYTALKSTEIFDPDTERWTETGALETARTQFSLTRLSDGRVLAVGGVRRFPAALSSAEVFDPALGAWASAGSMTSGRWNHRAVLLPSGEVLVVGGCDVLGELTSVELFTPTVRNAEN